MARLTALELRQMRHAAEEMLQDLCTVRRRSTTISGGEEVEAWTELASVPCRLSPQILRTASTEGDQFRVHAGWVLTVRYDQPISAADEVTMGGATYYVITVEDAQSNRVVRRAYMRRVSNG